MINSNINQDYFGSGEGGSGNTSGNTGSNTGSGTAPAQLEVITVKNYSQADVGDNPVVNLAVGRLKYFFSDLSVGHGNFNIAISHVYNSMLNENFRGNIVGLGNNWKLNLSQSIIQDYVNQDGAKIFKYMDELGEVHRFVQFAANRYYDDRNAKVTLTVSSESSVISDGVGNKLYFNSDGLLSKSVSCHNFAIEKVYNYDEQKRLVSVYDSRTVKNKVPKSRLELTYDGDYLTAMTSYGNFNKKLFCLTYEYVDGNLVSVNKVAFNKSGEQCVSQQIAEFCYKDNNLYRIIDSQTKQAYQFEYANGKLAKMSSGVIVDKTLSLGMTDSLGTPLQLGQVPCGVTFNREFVTKAVNSYKYTMYSATDPVAVQTDVTNSNNITLTYFIDRNACITSCFEKVGTDLKTLNKQGAKRISGNIENSTQTINGHYGIVPAEYGNPSWGGDIIFTVDGGLARSKAEQNVRNYEYSFWLKIPKAYDCMLASIEYTFASWAGKTRIERTYIDGAAVNAWQRVSLPVTVTIDSDGNPDTSRLTFWISLSGNKSAVKDCFEINEIGFAPAPYTEMLLANHNAIDIPFSKTKKAVLSVMDDSYNMVSREYVLNKDIFFTEADLIATRANEYAHSYYTIGQKLFDVICSNGTKRIANVSYLLFDNPDGGYSATSDIPFVIRTVTPDGGMTTATEYRFSSSTMTVATFGTRGDVTSAKAIVTDYRGKTLNETDEYEVSTQYDYDEYGRLTKTMVYAGNGQIGAVQNYSYNEDGSLYSTDNELNGQQFDYDEHEQLNRITLLEFDGEDTPLKATEHSTETKYGVFRDQPLRVNEHIGTDTVASNKVTYEKGRIRTVTDGTAKYGVKYDDVNSTVEYTQFNGDTEHTVQRDSVSEYRKNDEDIVTQSHTSMYFNDKGSPTESVSTDVDVYGRTVQVMRTRGENGRYDYEYDDSLRESKFASKPEKRTNYEKNEYTRFSYDYDGNLTGWSDEKYVAPSAPQKLFAVRQVSDNATKYTFGASEDYFAAIEYDTTRTLSPRVTATKYSSDSKADYDNASPIPIFGQTYSYDALGRLEKKENGVFSHHNYSYISKGSVSLLQKAEFRNYKDSDAQYGIPRIHQQEEYEYTDKAQVSKVKRDFSWQSFTDYNIQKDIDVSETKTLEYDKLGRITYEQRAINQTCNRDTTSRTASKSYLYGDNGRVKLITENSGLTHSYEYIDGKLKRVKHGLYSGTTYSYDFYGNRSSKNADGTETTYGYVQGNTLSKVTSPSGTTTFEYDVNGVRSAKKTNNVTTRYYSDGNKLLGESRPTTKTATAREIHYFYDKDGLVGLSYNKEYLLYVRDALNNITGIVHFNKRLLARYEYDTYGNCTVYDEDGNINTDPDFIGNINPIRWKSFYFDTETGLYYANGSYYDPEVGLYVDASPIDTVIDNALTTRSLDRNGLMCNNVLDLASNPYTISTSTELAPDPTYDSEANLPWWLRARNWIYDTIHKIANWYSNVHWSIKLGIGIFLLRLAVAFTVLTEGTGAAAIGVLIQVAIGVGVGIGMYALSSLIAGTFSWSGLANAALDAFLVSSAIAFVTSGISYVKHLCRSKPVSTAELAKEAMPPNNGAVPGSEEMITLEPGVYGRYGGVGPESRYITNAGASPEQLSLPPWNNRVYTEIHVIKPIQNVQKATVAPWKPWNGIGGGEQYFLPKTIKKLIRGGYIKIG